MTRHKNYGNTSGKALTAGEMIEKLKEVHPDTQLHMSIFADERHKEIEMLYAIPNSIDIDGTNIKESPDDSFVYINGVIDTIENKDGEYILRTDKV